MSTLTVATGLSSVRSFPAQVQPNIQQENKAASLQ